MDPDKRFHADWALWKAAPPGRELTWAAPWGTGFPGWHTECSAMSLHYLGDTIDVHTGGIDLRFPHHEDERAQSDSVTGHEVVRHWVHGEHLLFEGRKMAKSTQNVVLLSDLAERGLDPLALRLAFTEHRYRQQLNLTWSTLEAADATVRRWRQRVAEWANSPSRPMCAQYVADFLGAFDDDLDTPAALRVLRAVEKDSEVPPGAKFETFAYADQLLGLDLARDIGRAPAWRRRCPPGRPSCSRPGRPPGRRPTGRPRTGSAPNWPRWASRSGTRRRARPGLWEHAEQPGGPDPRPPHRGITQRFAVVAGSSQRIDG